MLKIKDLEYTVQDNDNSVEILKGLSLDVNDGEFLVITGPNGSEKSSLAKTIAGIYKPTAGSIEFDGTDVTTMSVTDRAKLGISFAFQQPVKFKGLEVLDLLRLASGNPKLSAAAACDYLSEVGLCARDYINREIDASLSGGELKRIEIASVLARKSRLILFDEPEAGIDLWSFSNLIRVFEKIKAETHATIIIISHQERILDIADRIMVLEKNGSMKLGKKEDILPAILGTENALGQCYAAPVTD